MVYSPLQVGSPVQIGNRTIRPITANHTVPAVGFHIGATAGSLVYFGRHAAHRGILAHRQWHFGPAPSHPGNGLCQPRAGPGRHRQASVPHPAFRRAGPAVCRSPDTHHASQALRPRADRPRDRDLGRALPAAHPADRRRAGHRVTVCTPGAGLSSFPGGSRGTCRPRYPGFRLRTCCTGFPFHLCCALTPASGRQPLPMAVRPPGAARLHPGD